MTTLDIAQEGFRRASSHEDKVYEAAKLFAEGKSGAKPLAQVRLLEAFSTSDFPDLLATGFTQQALTAQEQTPLEFEPLLANSTVDDFNEHKLVDLWGGDAFELVREGEEYRGGTLSESDKTHRVRKYGKTYGLTWELRRSRRFSDLANFPRYLGSGANKGRNEAVSDLLTEGGTWSADFFGTVETPAFGPNALDDAIAALAQRTDHRGDLVDTSNLILVHGPALRTEVNRVLRSTELEMQVTNGTKVTKTRVQNPFSNVVQALESRAIGKALSANPLGWALIPAGSSAIPAIVQTSLAGEETLDIRVKRDQGDRVGGGSVSVEDGSFMDDTIHFRGRDVYGVDEAYTEGVYASNGTVAPV